MVHGTFSPARAWRLAAAFGLTITLGSTSKAVGVQLPRLRHPPQRHALWPLLRGFFGLRNRTPGLLSSAHHRGPSKAGPLWECLGTHPPPAPVPAGAKAPGISIHSPQILGIHLSVLPNPSLSRDPTRQAAWASCRAGLCCTTPPKRLAARVAVSSNVRPHTAGMGNRSTSAFQDARRVQIRASAAARIRRLQADEPSTGERHQSPHRKRSEATSFMCALRGIRPRLASPASRVNQSVVPPPSGEVCRSPAWSAAAKRSWACAATPRLGLSKARLANLCSVRRAA